MRNGEGPALTPQGPGISFLVRIKLLSAQHNQRLTKQYPIQKFVVVPSCPTRINTPPKHITGWRERTFGIVRSRSKIEARKRVVT